MIEWTPTRSINFARFIEELADDIQSRKRRGLLLRNETARKVNKEYIERKKEVEHNVVKVD